MPIKAARAASQNGDPLTAGLWTILGQYVLGSDTQRGEPSLECLVSSKPELRRKSDWENDWHCDGFCEKSVFRDAAVNGGSPRRDDKRNMLKGARGVKRREVLIGTHDQPEAHCDAKTQEHHHRSTWVYQSSGEMI
jgi:hypothetical protein